MIIAIDFDGTICRDLYPECGALLPQAKEAIALFRAEGHKVVLWTCRTGEPLELAKRYLALHGIEVDRINESDPADIAKYGGDTRKINADFYIDDKAWGGFHGWPKIIEDYCRWYGLYRDEM